MVAWEFEDAGGDGAEFHARASIPALGVRLELLAVGMRCVIVTNGAEQ